MRDRISFDIDKPAQYYRGIRVKADLGLHDDVVSKLVPQLKAGSKVLDFGCGEGALSQRLADIGADVLAVDVDRDAFKASTPFVRVDFNDSSDVSRFIEGHRSVFDIVLGVEVIEHVENRWQYMRDLGSLVRVGGFVLVSTPNVTSWYSRINFLFRGRLHQFEDADREYGHINPVAADELRLIAEKSGMDVISFGARRRIATPGWRGVRPGWLRTCSDSSRRSSCAARGMDGV